jgi:signal peptidase II
MIVLLAALIAIPLIDLGVKRLVRRRLGSSTVALGPLGHLRVVGHRLWLARLIGPPRLAALWGLWLLAAAPLVAVGLLLPSSAVFVGLLLGGSLSNGLESSMRGVVTDYVCLRFWPAFNLADAALTIGAIGIGVALGQNWVIG